LIRILILKAFAFKGESRVSQGAARKIKIIINPNAGAGRGRRLFPLLRQKLLERKISFHLQFSESPEHVGLLARQAVREGYDLIVSGGGDGTSHRTLQALVGSRTVLGCIPMGTGNDLPLNLGIREDLDFACDLLVKGKVRRIDVIQVDSGEYMAGVGGIGFDSEVNAVANRINRFWASKRAYFLPTLWKVFTYEAKQITLRLDQETITRRILLAAFGNFRSYGHGMQITALAEPDDGLLDVCLIDPIGPFRFYRFFPRVYGGDHLERPEVHYYRSSVARVESPVSLALFGDGEFLCRTPFSLRVIPQALRVLVP
jgi:diacylglycerol kinase (ATP)